jgi:hypothetical protein
MQCDILIKVTIYNRKRASSMKLLKGIHSYVPCIYSVRFSNKFLMYHSYNSHMITKQIFVINAFYTKHLFSGS